MVLRRDGQLGMPHPAAVALQTGESNGAGGFLQDMAIDENQVAAVVRAAPRRCAFQILSKTVDGRLTVQRP